MIKKINNQVAPEHTTIEPIHGNVVKLTADDGWLLKSKHTGKIVRCAITARVENWEVVNILGKRQRE